MKNALAIVLATATVALSACATTEPGSGEGACKAEPGQRFVGQKATAETGNALLRETGAKQLRWGPPRSAMTMDFRADRLTVSYDDNYTIERVSCG